MARYDYYCTHCGKQLNQDIVLFDMQYLLTREKERQFNILKFRMTQAELRALIASGAPAEAGYRSCKLTLAEVMRYISNPNNLNDPDIATLTIEEIDEYVKQAMGAATEKSTAADTGDLFGFDDDEELEEEEDLGAEAAAPYVTPPSILKIEAKDETNKDKVYTRSVLMTDLQVLQGLFATNGVFEFQIREQFDVDNEGGDVLVGYNLNLTVGGYLSLETRVCGKCGQRVFSHAGTAKHQAVAFIGYAAAGKTSTILALAHYAENYMITGFGSEIWEGCKTVDSVATVEVLDKNDRFVKELELYEKGVAPEKTKDTDRTDAYSATFRIKNRAENRYYLFTLTDLPGELFKKDGTVKREKVYNDFPVAVSCDAFVACFDTQAKNDAGGGNIVEKAMNVCRWADEIQKMRADHNQTKTYVPTMLLFTKCQELEVPAAALPAKKAMMPLERMYMLGEEKQRIAANRLYDFVCKQFDEFGQLKKGYHAMMRCSPFGYLAPSEDNWRKGIGEAPHSPTPKNIDMLMRWLLSVAGCIPTEASYAVSLTSVPFNLQNFCIGRPQLRSENPLEKCDVEESMARCALFENPGYFDREFVGRHGDKGKLFPVRMESKLKPDSNDRR